MDVEISDATDGSTENPRLALFRGIAVEHAKSTFSSALPDKVVLEAFGAAAAGSHRGLLLRLREQLETLLLRAANNTVDVTAGNCSLGARFSALDKAALNTAVAGVVGTEIDGTDGEGKQSEVAATVLTCVQSKPFAKLRQERVAAKREELAALEDLIGDEETAVTKLRRHVQSVYDEAVAAQQRVIAMTEQATSMARSLA
jgi:hypothetical protein